jgi:hypothetical protein
MTSIVELVSIGVIGSFEGANARPEWAGWKVLIGMRNVSDLWCIHTRRTD